MWNHANSLITDDFLDQSDLENIIAVAKKFDTPEPKMRHVIREGIVDVIDTQYYCEKYRKKLTDIYYDLNGFPCPKYTVSMCLTLTGRGYVHKAHCDAPHKLLSSVVYISPEHETGTYYNEDDTMDWNSPEAPWKVNRAFSFSAKQGVTWHRFRSLVDKRVTVNFHLSTQMQPMKKLGNQIRNSYT